MILLCLIRHIRPQRDVLINRVESNIYCSFICQNQGARPKLLYKQENVLEKYSYATIIFAEARTSSVTSNLFHVNFHNFSLASNAANLLIQGLVSRGKHCEKVLANSSILGKG